jgi:predicted AlkP superfamily phosphohydrolase/phosphomutase
VSSAKHLLIGLDGAGLDLLRALGPTRVPHLTALMERGACAALRSVQPPATLPNWATLLTGTNPGVHGVFDFTTRSGYRVSFTAGSVRAAPTVAAHLDHAGLSCACLFFPGTYPPEPLKHGVFVSGWDAPVAFEADRSFVHPQVLHDELVARFGPQRFDDVDEFDADAPGWHSRLPDALCARIARRTELAQYLLQKQPWDLFAIYFGESDTAAHHLWALHDPSSPRRPAHVDPHDADGLARVYCALDAAVGALVAQAPHAEVTIVSDHGSGGASDKVLYLNRALADAGLLAFRESTPVPALRRLKDLALTRLPPRLRERVFRSFGAVLPGWLESQARFANIDMPSTVAFSDELNYFPAIHWNLRGREPDGVLDPADVPRVRAQLTAALLALRDPWTDRPVVSQVWARETLFEGPWVERAPDLLLELALDDGHSYNLMPSAGAPAGTGAFRKLSPDEYLGRKGRSLAGSHRPRGLWIAAGPGVRPVGEIDAAMADVTATLLARMGGAQVPHADGRVLDEALLKQTATVATTVQAPLPAPTPPSLRGAQSARVEERLRRLGYVE